MNGSPVTVVRAWLGSALRACAVIIALTISNAPVLAQLSLSEAENGSDLKASPTASPAVVAEPTKGEAQKPSESKPDDEAKKSEDEKKPDETKPADAAQGKKPDEPMPLRRPTEPKQPANPDELKVRPVDGKVTFSFKGQPWPAVLEWLADISEMSLEWQEAPPGYLDLTTRRRYTVAEARDLLNYILLGRGYTLLRNGEVLMVASLKNLDASLVPRVTPEELDGRDNFELVRVFFDLNRLQAEQLVEDLQPLKSQYGKITAMKTTNRIDVLETAGNLRRLRDIIASEQSASGQETMLKEFQLQHARAEVVIVTLEKLLGIESKKPGGPMSADQMQQQMQEQQRMMEMQREMQQHQHGSGQGGQQKQKKEPTVVLAVYERKNAILATATPDKLAIVEQAIALLDVPSARSTSPLQQMARVKSYRLVAVDPKVVVDLLKELGNLDPSTRLEIDAPNRVIIADAPLVDHLTIQQLVEKIDGSARRMEVIPLRKLNAEYVAGSIEVLMRGPKQDERRPRYWYYDSSNRSGNDQKDGGFQVEPDIENNRLLVRVNDIELEEIRALLVKLGEDPYRDPRGETMRVMRSRSGPEMDRLLDRLRHVWPSVSPVPLEIEAPPSDANPAEQRFDRGESTGETETKPSQPAPKKTQPPAERSASAVIVHPSALAQRAALELAGNPAAGQLAADDSAAETTPAVDIEPEAGSLRRFSGRGLPPQANEPLTAATLPPSSATISRGAHGLIFSASDPETLEKLTTLAEELSAEDMDNVPFQLKHTYAKDMAELLSKIFAEDGAKEPTNSRRNYYFFDEPPPKEKKEMGRLSRRPPLRFIPDPVTNTILVQGADARQMAEIRALIKYYDTFEEPNSESVRQTEFITFKYAKSREVAEVLKEVFRDLLSPNDKSLMQFNMQKAQQEQQNRPLISYFDSDPGANKSADENLPRFKGLLSIGVDQRSNSIFISAPGKLLKTVKAMAEGLDAAAKPQEPVTRVIHMGGAITDPYVKEALRNFADPAARRNSQRDRQQNTASQNDDGSAGRRRNNQNNQNRPRNNLPAGGF